MQRRYLEAYEFRPSRRGAGRTGALLPREEAFRAAHLYAQQAVLTPMTSDILFVDTSAYTWRALDELSVAAYWIGDYAGSAATCRKLLNLLELPDAQRPRILENLKFSKAKLK